MIRFFCYKPSCIQCMTRQIKIWNIWHSIKKWKTNWKCNKKLFKAIGVPNMPKTSWCTLKHLDMSTKLFFLKMNHFVKHDKRIKQYRRVDFQVLFTDKSKTMLDGPDSENGDTQRKSLILFWLKGACFGQESLVMSWLVMSWLDLGWQWH